MRRLFVAGVVAVSTMTPVAAQPAHPPRLVIAIAVDQFSADLFDQYRPSFTGGLARIGGGTAYRNGYQAHNTTETCPGMSTILTGDHPARTGIIANNWTDPAPGRADKSVYCAEDERVAGSSSSNYTVSARHLRVATLGELMKARWPASRTVAIAGKDRAAVMMGGHTHDQRWYWATDHFATDLADAPVPGAVTRANAAIAAALAEPRDALIPSLACAALARPIAVGDGGKTVGGGAFGRNANDPAGFRASPELDGDTLALAAGLVDEMKLGQGAAPDLLALSLSATDYVGHTYGTQGQEMCLQLTQLDRELGDFLALLDQRGIDYAVVLTADHGGLDLPERARLMGHADAARITPDLDAGAVGLRLAHQLHLPGPGLLGGSAFGDIYVDRSLQPADRQRMIVAAVADYRHHSQVEVVFTANQLKATPLPTVSPDRWSLIERARASFDPDRSGDFVVLLKKNVTPISDTSKYVATHGSAWDYDRRVPILFWRPGQAATASDTPVDTVDIMPTLAATIGLPIAPASVDGHCLAAVAGDQCPLR